MCYLFFLSNLLATPIALSPAPPFPIHNFYKKSLTRPQNLAYMETGSKHLDFPTHLGLEYHHTILYYICKERYIWSFPFLPHQLLAPV